MRSIVDDHSGTRYKKGQWTPEEDLLLMKYIETHGEGKWRTLPQKAGLQRCGKGCRLRWKSYLRPNVKRGNISLEEEDLIIRLHKLVGNRWSLIAGRVPGRTDSEIKNYWNSHLSKKIRCNVNIESSSHNKASSSSSDHFHSSENDLIDSGVLHKYNQYSSLPDWRMDCLASQQQEYYQSSHMACAFHQPPHLGVEDISTRFSQYLSTNHDVGLSTEAWLQQPLAPSGHFYEKNEHVFHSMVAMQPMYCSSSSLCIGSCYDEIWDQYDFSDLGRTEMQGPPQLASDYESLSKIYEDSITNDFDADVQSMNSIVGRANTYNNLC